MGKSMEAEEVYSFRDLTEYLAQAMPLELREAGGEIRSVNNAVKSFVVEASPDSTKLNFESVFRSTEVRKTNEPHLIHAYNSDLNVFIDSRDQRFLLVHSISKMQRAETFIQAYFNESDIGYDRAWLPTKFLESVRSTGNLRGFRFEHLKSIDGARLDFGAPNSEPKRIDLPDLKSSPELERSIPSVVTSAPQRPSLIKNQSSLTFRDSDTAEIDYNEMIHSGIFQDRHALEWIQYDALVSESNAYINQIVYFDGKITAYGSSTGLHLYLVESLRDRYASSIRQIEGEFGMKWVHSASGMALHGEPLYIHFPENLKIDNLVKLVRSLFRAAAPFRMFGSLTSRSSTRVDIDAIDLHTGGRFSVEATKSWMRIYLPTGTCGNVIARFLTVLQRTIGSQSRLVDGGNTELLTGE